MPRILLPVILALVLALPASAARLEVVGVAAPSVNCVFDADCTTTVTDSLSPISLPGTSGEGFLQTRTLPPGEEGTPGAGLTSYLYRIDLSPIGGVTAQPCITELSIDFGPLAPLDYDGDGDPDDAYVVTRGGIGSVRPASADQVGDRITFRFLPAVCAGNRPGAGDSTFFFGLAAEGEPTVVAARATALPGGALELEARAPGGDGGGGGGGGMIGGGLCLGGLPITSDAPICRCLRDRVLRELRCALLHPDFFLIRRTPLPGPVGQPFPVRWSFTPLGGFSGSVVVEDGVAPGFARPQGPAPLTFQAEDGQPGGVTLEYRLTASEPGGRSSVPGLVTVRPSGGRGEAETIELLLPIGTLPWPDLGDAPTEPVPSPPANPRFGADRCGRVAQELWDEHVERFSTPPFRPSLAAYTDLRTRAERCRRAMPPFGGLCGRAGEAAWVDCFMRRGRNCPAAASEAIAYCRRFVIEGIVDDALGGHRDDLFDF